MPSTATPLTAEQTQQLRTQLLQRQEQLLQELDEVKRATLAQIPNQGDAGHPFVTFADANGKRQVARPQARVAKAFLVVVRPT